MRLPDFLVAGFPKSGTTSLAGWLSDHPDVYVPPQKEIDFFDLHWSRGLDWYGEHFADAGSATLVGEGSVRYVARPLAHERIATVLPEVRMIVLVREPVARAVSHYWYRSNWRPPLPLADLVEQEIAGVARGDDGSGAVAWGRYAHYLDGLAEHVARDRIRVWTLDDLKVRPEEVFAEVCAFLGVDAAVLPPSVGSSRNESFTFRSLRLHEAMRRYRLYRRLPFRLGYRLDRFNRVPFRYPPPDPAVLRRLHEFYAPHREALSAWVEVPASWSDPPPSG